jgi:tRNA wybutosine-synthesizing protein 3
MDFQKQKQKYLADIAAGNDKSKKGSIDDEIKDLIAAINKNQNYYTTSSCAGRILLYSTPETRKKNETQWLFVSHNTVTCNDIKKVLHNQNLPTETIFFRFEPLILHVACKDMQAAITLLRKSHESGLKHSGIMSVNERIIVEIIGSDLLDAPIAKERLLVNDEWLAVAVQDANAKMQRNKKRIEKLTLLFSEHNN